MSFGPVSTKLSFYDEQNRFFISSIGYELSITQNINIYQYYTDGYPIKFLVYIAYLTAIKNK